MNQYYFDQLKNNKELLKTKFDISKIGIFGSYARGEENENSDIDILVEFRKLPDLFKYIDIEIYLEKLCNKKIDLVEYNSIRNELKEKILEEVQYI